MSRPGADLIAHYLDPGRLSAGRQWSRKHAHTQRRLCERFAAPVIDAVTCQDITVGHMQQIVNAAPTPGEGGRVQGMISALVSAGLEGGYLANPRLARVHWQAGDRPLPPPRVSVVGESALWVDPAGIPASEDIAELGRALARGRHGERDELMANAAAYSGLRWGELTALTTGQIDQVGRVITVDRKVVEIAGHLYVEAPKNRKMRRTIYPRATPGGYPLAARLADRIKQARVEQRAGTNPLGLIFPSPTGKHWRSSNFNRNVLQRAYLAAGWRDEHGNGACRRSVSWARVSFWSGSSAPPGRQTAGCRQRTPALVRPAVLRRVLSRPQSSTANAPEGTSAARQARCGGPRVRPPGSRLRPPADNVTMRRVRPALSMTRRWPRTGSACRPATRSRNAASPRCSGTHPAAGHEPESPMHDRQRRSQTHRTP